MFKLRVCNLHACFLVFGEIIRFTQSTVKISHCSLPVHVIQPSHKGYSNYRTWPEAMIKNFKFKMFSAISLKAKTKLAIPVLR
jgi:hypothetical protein